jgi:[ribosomal protein S5]-alanine N-acetyltransferase
METLPAPDAAEGAALDILTQPTLVTERLVLRPFALSDAARVHELAGAVEIADTTLSIPHPYPEGAAEQWIALHAEMYARGVGANWAIVPKETGELAGAVGLMLTPEHSRAELAYWVGVPFWGRGFCTEAAREVVRHAFGRLGVERVFACHFSRNAASGKVMRKIGMRHEGTFRRHLRKWGKLEDVEFYGLVVEDVAETEGAATGRSPA